MPTHRYATETIRAAAETQALRRVSTMLSLFGLCHRRACRRARACHGAPRDCLSRYAPLVPEDAREGVKAMIEGWRLGLTFDELMGDAPGEVAAIGAWSNAVAASRRKRPKGQP